jgi:hypothetical protein
MTTTTFQQEGPGDKALTRAWLAQFDPSLSAFNSVVDGRMAAFPAGDRRPHCEAWVESVGHVCVNFARENSRYCGTHQRHRRPVELFGPER